VAALWEEKLRESTLTENYTPYWSEELVERLDEQLSAARREAETTTSQDNHIHLQHTKASFLRYKLQARRKSWRTKQHHLTLETWRKMVPSCGD